MGDAFDRNIPFIWVEELVWDQKVFFLNLKCGVNLTWKECNFHMFKENMINFFFNEIKKHLTSLIDGENLKIINVECIYTFNTICLTLTK